ncbi:MAG TPA: beta-propeller fold lactonase family protein [Solirubrobacteraceae bacterium]|jgi:hypothetical protein
MALLRRTSLLAATMTLALCGVAHAEQDLYLASTNTSEVFGWHVAADGGLSSVPGSPFPGGATSFQGMTISPDGRWVFAVDDDNNRVLSAVRAADGSLTPTPDPDAPADSGAFAVVVTPDGRYVYVSNFIGDTISGYAVAADGSLVELSGSPFPSENDVAGLAVSADSERLYALSRDGFVAGYAIVDGGLVTLPSSPYATGGSPFSLTIAPDDGHVFVADRDNDEVVSHEVNADGSLDPAGGSPGQTEGNPFTSTLTADGRFLYTGNYDAPSISGFAVGDDGSLTELDGSPWPRPTAPASLTTNAPGNLLFAGDGDEDRVVVFAIDGDGAIEEIPDSPFAAATVNFGALALSPETGPGAEFTNAGGQTMSFDAAASTADAATYRWDFGDGTVLEDGGPTPTHAYRAGGRYEVTLTVTEDFACPRGRASTGQTVFCAGSPTASTSRAIDVPADPVPNPAPPVPPPLPPDVTDPIISSLGLSRSRFRAAPRGPTIAARVGTRVRVAVSEASTGAFRVQRRTIGRRSGRRCVAKRRSNARRRRCVRWVGVGRIARPLQSGANAFTYRARHGGRRLRPGRYRMAVRATDAAGNASTVRRVSFRIVRR